MESANLHPPDHKVQEQHVKYSSLLAPTSHQVSTIDEWNPNFFPNFGSKYDRDLNETISAKDPWQAPPLIRTSMNQDSFIQQSASEFLLANIKDEMSDSFPKLSEMMYCHSTDHSHLPSKKHYCPQYPGDYNLGGNLWHSNFANNMTELQLSAGELYNNVHHSPCPGTTPATSRYDFNQVFPCTNLSTSDFCSTLLSSSLDLNLKSLDILTSTYDGGSYNQSLLDMIPGKLSRNVFISHESNDQRREHSDSTSISSKVSTFDSGSNTSTKRPGSFSDTKESTHTDAKKHRSSCPTLKLQVRKEKLGDRIAALQKLVAPFGKTDTSTVLTEAIGYIQFLQDQVQTLSVPFTKPSQSKLHSTKRGGSSEEEGKEEQKCDLRSRGLCLVPQSLASYFINSCSSGIYTSPY